MRIPVVALLSLSLTGCALSNTASPTAETGLSIQGKVHGGQQPIVGAHVYLLAANTTGYGGNGIAASTSNASVSLLTSSTGHVDTIGYYVLTGSDGSFTITGDYTCTAGQQVYLYALGGNPGAGTNSAAGLMAILGNCPGTTFPASTYVWINEVSTVAAAYAFAGFATDATHVSSSGTALAKTGIANAFANATNLASLSTGAALATTPAGNGTVPQATINTLANILTACVNSTGPTSGTCSTLFTNAKSAGTTGTSATDTATAAINIAHNPANVTALYAIPTPAVAFAPVLTAQPNDLTISIIFSGGGLTGQSFSVAIDASGNAWIANPGSYVSGYAGSVTELSSLGTPISGSGGFGDLGAYPFSLAIDLNGDVWIANFGIPSGTPGFGSTPGSVTELAPNGAALSGASGYITGGVNKPRGTAVDGQGLVWVFNSGTGTVTRFGYLGDVFSGTSGFSSTALQAGSFSQIAIDGSLNAWVLNSAANDVAELSFSGANLSGSTGFPVPGNNSDEGIAVNRSGDVWIAGGAVYKLSNSGTVLSPTGGYTSGGINGAQQIAIDGDGNVWISNQRSISEISNAGLPITGSNGYLLPTFAVEPFGIAVDGSGDLWVTDLAGWGLRRLCTSSATPA
jgi:streptogramin lyase